MPVCRECGFTAPRLQWTHFKYKCTGRFNNGKEYQKVYPGALLVEPELAKRTAVTRTNLIEKYGKVEGEKRWNEYRNKQAESNTFKYKKEKHGWDEEQFELFNKSRAVTLENIIERHGEEGYAKWKQYCERQAYTNTLPYYIEKYGNDGYQKYLDVNALKTHTIENVMRVHKCSQSQALRILVDRNTRLAYTSELEQCLVMAIEREIGELHYTHKNKQYCVWGNDKANFYDIVHNRRAIEFNGDYWHCNPDLYKANYIHPHSDCCAQQIWENDRKKIDLLKKERNIDTLVIWETDYLKEPEQTIKRCVKWVQNEKE